MVPKIGRPEIGPMITLRITEDDLQSIDEAAQTQQITRAEWLRRAARDRLAIPREELGAFIEWLIEETVDASEIRRVIEKPHQYTDWLEAFTAGKSLHDPDDV